MFYNIAFVKVITVCRGVKNEDIPRFNIISNKYLCGSTWIYANISNIELTIV